MTAPLDLDATTGVVADHARTRHACPRNGNCSTCNNIANELERRALALIAELRALRAENERLRRDLSANEGSEDARLAIAEAEVARLCSAVDADHIARAIGDPGSVVGRKFGPSWGEGNAGYAPEEETVTRWATRAVLAVLGRGKS